MSQDSRGREARREIPFGPRGPGPLGTGEHARDVQGTVRWLWGYLRQQRLGLVGVFLLVAASTAETALMQRRPIVSGVFARSSQTSILTHTL